VRRGGQGRWGWLTRRVGALPREGLFTADFVARNRQDI
jgi:hypothetical protein